MTINVISININLTDKTYAEVHALARARETTVSALVRNMISVEYAKSKDEVTA
jgi:post-segregation antitoxin (ccd killing protein)